MQAFRDEEGIPTQTTLVGRLVGFEQASAQGHLWAGLAEGKIVSTASVFAIFAVIGQVEALYTVPAHRRRGLSRAVVSELARDSRARLGLSRLLLFTGEANLGARALYESLG